MYTQCPHCFSIYRIGADELSAAGGRVQCDTCEIVFNALPALRDELPENAGRRWESVELPFSESGVEDGDDESGDGDGRHESAFAMPAAPDSEPSRVMRAVWMLGSAALTLGLVAQLLFLAPRALARNPELRPLAMSLCRVSGCEVAPRVDLDRLRLASRDVRAHPSVPGALIISATLVNEASFTQPFPVLEISLSDLQGRPVAIRRFLPREYLPGGVNMASGMTPESAVQVSLEVSDPGEQAVAFEFAFRASD